MIYDEETGVGQVFLTNFAGDAAALSEAFDPSDAAVEASEEAVAFLESVFQDRDQDLIQQLLHPFECLDSEPQKRLQEPESANQKSQEC